MNKRLIEKLDKRREEGTLRSLSHFEGFSDFFSNDYLGLSKAKLQGAVEKGGTGSRLISGTTSTILSAEQTIADFFSAEAGLMFNSGYDANIGFFSSVPQRGDTVIYDELIHASVRDGLRMSFAGSIAFRHNDIEHLEERIKNAKGGVYVAVESLYSMDGDIAPLRQIGELCEQYNAYLVVDEAHAAGVYGANGTGMVSALNMEDKVFARLITYGKAYGSHGGCVVGSRILIDFLLNFARSFIYTTALPEQVYSHNAEVIRVTDLNERRNLLQKNLAYFRKRLQHPGLISEVNSPIQIVQIGGVSETRHLAEALLRSRIAVKPIYSPTVPAGKERLRLCLHSFNSEEELDKLITILS